MTRLIRTGRVPFLLSASALLLLLRIRDNMVLGDGAAYGNTIASGHLVERSIHVGYYGAIWLLSRLLAPTHVLLDQLMIGANAVFMGFALLLAGRLFERLGATPLVAAVATFTLLMTGNVLQQGSGAEIYAFQLLVILAAQNLFFDRRYVGAGLAYGLAMLTSPLTVFACGPFLWQSVRTRDPRPLLKTAVWSAVVYLPVFAFVWREYLYGVRGLLRVGLHRAFDLPTLGYNAFAIVQNFHWMVPFLLLGLLRSGNRGHGWRGLVAATVLMYLPLLLGFREQGVFILPAYPFLALVAAGEAVRLIGKAPRVQWRVAWGSLAAACIATSSVLWVEPRDREPRDLLARFLATVPAGSVAVTDWGGTPTVPFYFRLWGVRGTPPHIIQLESATHEQIEQALHDHANVYLIDEVHLPSRRSRLLRETLLRGWPRPLSPLAQLRALDPGIEASLVTDQHASLVIYRLTPALPTHGPAPAQSIANGHPEVRRAD